MNEIERLRNQRSLLQQAVVDLETQLESTENELFQVQNAIRSMKETDQPVLYSIAPVGVPTQKTPIPASYPTVKILFQQQTADAHGNMIDVII